MIIDVKETAVIFVQSLHELRFMHKLYWLSGYFADGFLCRQSASSVKTVLKILTTPH